MEIKKVTETKYKFELSEADYTHLLFMLPSVRPTDPGCGRLWEYIITSE